MGNRLCIQRSADSGAGRRAFQNSAESFFSAGEGGFLTVLVWGGIAWSALLLLAGMKLIHEYDGKQAVLSVIFTGVGMLLMAFYRPSGLGSV